jgi:hypothetical protein
VEFFLVSIATPQSTYLLVVSVSSFHVLFKHDPNDYVLIKITNGLYFHGLIQKRLPETFFSNSGEIGNFIVVRKDYPC